MSLSYLMNCVATLATAGLANIPEEIMPASSILDETELVPSELRLIFQDWKPSDKKYLRERRIRELTHQLKGSEPMEFLDSKAKIEVLPDEQI